MTDIRAVDLLFLDDLFEMGGGYVLNFSDRTFVHFLVEGLNLDIDDPAYAVNGGSKGKRLRYFLQTVDKPTVVRALNALWEYRQALRQRSDNADQIENAHGQLLALISRLEGRSGHASPAGTVPTPAFDRPKITKIKADLIGLSLLAPQELHTFYGKIEQKAAWTRGLFVSNSGFTEDGIAAFGRGKRVICMDGLDLFEMLHREIPFNHLLERKIRRAAETGSPFMRVRDLFPN